MNTTVPNCYSIHSFSFISGLFHVMCVWAWVARWLARQDIKIINAANWTTTEKSLEIVDFSRESFWNKRRIFQLPGLLLSKHFLPNDPFHEPAKKKSSVHWKRIQSKQFFFCLIAVFFLFFFFVLKWTSEEEFIGGTRENRKGFCAISK